MEKELENNDSQNVEEKEEETQEETIDESEEETQDEETSEEESEESIEQHSDESLEDYKARIAQLERENKTLKIQKAKARQKKAEPKQSSNNGTLSNEDVIAIARSNIHDDDIQTVREYAQFRKISIKEALNDSVVKSIIDKNESKRKAGNASNMGNSKRGQAKVSEEVLLEQARKGEMPDESDLDRLIASKYKK